MKKIKTIIAALMMITLASAAAVAANVEMTPVEIELVDGYTTSYKVAPTADVLGFLANNGVDVTMLETGNAKTLTSQILSIYRVEPADEEISLKQQLVNFINAALFRAIGDGANVAYMEIGQLRWTMYPAEE